MKAPASENKGKANKMNEVILPLAMVVAKTAIGILVIRKYGIHAIIIDAQIGTLSSRRLTKITIVIIASMFI